MSDVFEMILRGFIAFLFPLLFIHLTGKQWLSQTTYAYFIGAISLGSIAGNTVFNMKIDLIYFIGSLIVFCMIIYLSSVMAMKNQSVRNWIQGEPTLIISDGMVREGTMKKLHYSMENLRSALRKKDIFDIHQVEQAMLEPDGSLSVLKKKELGNGSKAPAELILEGKLQEDCLKCESDIVERLHEELRRRGMHIVEIRYAAVGTNGKLYILPVER
jgi:uncharacterized membrane protein YcaP (DUF421 family)